MNPEVILNILGLQPLDSEFIIHEFEGVAYKSYRFLFSTTIEINRFISSEFFVLAECSELNVNVELKEVYVHFRVI